MPPVVLVIGGISLVFTFMFLSFVASYIKDHICLQPQHLQREVFLASPNRTTVFLAATDGTLELVDIRSGHLLGRRHINTEEYLSVEPKWESNDSLEILLPLRYPFKAKAALKIWNAKTGVFD